MTISYVCEHCGTLLYAGEKHSCVSSDWKVPAPKLSHDELVAEMVSQAHAEDAAAGEDARFDREGWSNFFLEDWKTDPDAVDEAWSVYDEELAAKAKSSTP